MKATLSNYRQAPRKVRLVANLIRGKGVPAALESLSFLNKRAADPMKKLLESAVANAKSQGLDPAQMVIKEIQVGGGVVFTRFMPRARGSASPINKRTSHISLVLAPAEIKKAKEVKKEVTKPEKAEKKVPAKKAKAVKAAK